MSPGSPDGVSQPPVPGLKTALSERLSSSDSTVGIRDSPRHAPGGLKTDEDEYPGRRHVRSRQHPTEPLTTRDDFAGESALGYQGGVPVRVDPATTESLPPTTLDPESSFVVNVASPTSATHSSGASSRDAGARVAGPKCGEPTDENESSMFRCESGSTNDTTTRIGSFCAPPAAVSRGADASARTQPAINHLFDRHRSTSGGDGGGNGGGSPATPAALENDWENGSETAPTSAETPAAGAALQSENLAGSFELRRHRPVAKDGAGCRHLGHGVGGTGDQYRRSPKRTGVEKESERRGSMLDVFREPEPCAQENDWADLEHGLEHGLDHWQGLPGLGFGPGGVGEGQPRLQVRVVFLLCL